MYYKYLETDAAAKSRHDASHKAAAADRMKKVSEKRARIRRQNKNG